MPATVLAVGQQFCRRNNLPVPTAVVGSTDARVLQVLQLLADVGMDVWRRSNWRVCMRRASWTSIASEDQGLITAIAGIEDPDHIVPRTFWDVTLRRPIFGPVSDYEYQQLKAFVPGSPLYQFQIRENKIFVFPALVVNHTLSFTYKTQRKWQATGGGVFKVDITADTDVSVFPDNVIELGLDFMWKQSKGKGNIQAAEDKYEEALSIMAGSDSVQPAIHMDRMEQNLQPGIWVPQGNWPVS